MSEPTEITIVPGQFFLPEIVEYAAGFYVRHIPLTDAPFADLDEMERQIASFERDAAQAAAELRRAVDAERDRRDDRIVPLGIGAVA